MNPDAGHGQNQVWGTFAHSGGSQYDFSQTVDGTKYDSITFDEVIKKGLTVMDSTAFTLSQENELPIVVFDMNKSGNLLKIYNGENIGTVVKI